MASGKQLARLQATAGSGELNFNTSSSSYASRDSVGFMNYFRQFVQYERNDDERPILEQARSDYRRQLKRKRKMSRQARHDESVPVQIFLNIEDSNMKRKLKNYNPEPKVSQGLLNYFKMYMCRHPHVEECAGYEKAYCLYQNLTERTKTKYRSMQCGYSPPSTLTLKKSGSGCSSKPKRKKSKPKNACCPKPKRRKAKKCPEPKPCPPKRKPRSRKRSCGPQSR